MLLTKLVTAQLVAQPSGKSNKYTPYLDELDPNFAIATTVVVSDDVNYVFRDVLM
jgi:hypothetical protein